MLLISIQPVPGSVTTPERLEQIQGQINQLKALFRRQLSLPLRGMSCCIYNIEYNTIELI